MDSALQSEPDTRARALLQWLLASVGLLTFGRFVWHLASHFSALQGVHAWTLDHPMQSQFTFWWALPCAVYAIAGAWLLVTTPALWRTSYYFAASGAACVAYAGLHIAQFLVVQSGPATSTRAIYEIMWEHAGEWRWVPIHVVGICAISLHAALGIPKAAAVLIRWRSDAARHLGVVVGIALLLVQVQLLSNFALGRPLVSVSSESDVK